MSIDETARNLSIVLIKISVYARRSDFRSRLERLSFQLIESVATRDVPVITSILASVKALISVGQMIYEVETMNAAFILSEISRFEDLIKEFSAFSDHSHFSTKSLFTPLDTSGNAAIEQKTASRRAEVRVKKSNIYVTQEISAGDKEEKVVKPDNATKGILLEDLKSSLRQSLSETNVLNSPKDDNATMRQSAILDKIRQSNDNQAQLKDVIAAFPSVSERTLRYDLARLSTQGIIERIGPGGPGTYYKIRVI